MSVALTFSAMLLGSVWGKSGLGVSLTSTPRSPDSSSVPGEQLSGCLMSCRAFCPEDGKDLGVLEPDMAKQGLGGSA